MAKLQKGINDLKTWCLNNGDWGQQILNEWTGECEDGKHYEIDEVARCKGRKKFKWICSEGHEWYATVAHRTHSKCSCTYCANNVRSAKVSKSKLNTGINDLKTWCSNNGDFGQQLMQEWTGECDDGKHYGIDEVSFGSTKKFKWLCDKGHVWWTKVITRTNHKSGCPYCSGNKVSNENSLKTWCLSSGKYGQQLLQEWTGQCEDGEHYEIDEISFGSHNKLKWRCSEGHEWYQSPHARSRQKLGCPYCSGHRVSDKNSLKSWCFKNGEFGQQLMQEWTGQCEDCKQYKINEVSYGSRKRFTWNCDKGHRWLATIVDRVIHKSACPYCSNSGTSYPEQFIYWSLKQIYPNTENRCRVLKSPQNPHGIEFDIGIPDIPLCIEYSPTYWHGENQERDNYKKEICEKANVRLLQIVEDSYDELEHKNSDNYICFKMDYNKQDETLVYIVDHILKSTGHSISEINIELAKKNALEYSKGKVEYEKSLEFNHPELAKEWHQTLNNGLQPADITCGSHRKIYWQCQNCSYGSNGEWCVDICNRVHGKSGCPSCGYNWFDGKIYETFGSKIVIKGVNDIQSRYPRLVEEWHQTLNININPTDMLCGSHKAVYWQCTKCNYGSTGAWRSPIRYRTTTKSGCPKCGYNWFDAKIHNVRGVAETGINDLQSQHPELAEEWHPTLNKDLKPEKLKCGSNTKIYWQCPICNHGSKGEWRTEVKGRAHGKTGCPNCGHNWYKAQQGLPQKYKGKYSYLNDQKNP